MNNPTRIAIIGGTGNGFVVAQIIEDMQSNGAPVEIAGFLNDHQPVGSTLGDWPVLAKPADWQLLEPDILFVYALLSVGKMHERTLLLEALEIPDARLATVVHPTAVIARSARIAPGCVIASHVTCQPGCDIDKNTFVRAGANIGHDVQVGSFVDIGPNCTLCGYAVIGKGAHIAANSVVKDSIEIEEFSVLSAGSVALKPIPAHSSWMGNPARRVK